VKGKDPSRRVGVDIYTMAVPPVPIMLSSFGNITTYNMYQPVHFIMLIFLASISVASMLSNRQVSMKSLHLY
jgi:hypothetical protein